MIDFLLWLLVLLPTLFGAVLILMFQQIKDAQAATSAALDSLQARIDALPTGVLSQAEADEILAGEQALAARVNSMVSGG